MSKPVNQTVIGIFVVVAIALVVAAVLVLGSGKFFKHNQKFVMYFQESVKGLSVGSPVDFRGVKVGTVTDIKMLFNPKDLSMIIPVYVEIEEGSFEAVQGGQSLRAFKKLHSMKDLAQELVKHGLRAQLEMQSIVTGQLMVSLDFHPDKPATPVGADHRYPEIPTIPSSSLQQLSQRVAKLPIEETFEKLNAAIGGIEKLVDSPETAGTIKAIRQAVDETRSLAHNLDNQVNPLAARMTDLATQVQALAGHIDNQIGPMAYSVTKAADEADITLKKAQATMGTIEELTGEDSPVSYRLGKALEDLASAARSLRLLADTIQHQPNAVIFGKEKTGGK
jgi:paraquat-inducible protein B